MQVDAQYHNIHPNKPRGCKRRYDLNDNTNCYGSHPKVHVTEQEMSSRLHSLSLDQIEISNFLLYPQLQTLQPLHQYTYTPPDNSITPPIDSSLPASQEQISEDELTDEDIEETDTMLTQENLKLALNKTTEILPREIIDSIISAFPANNCTTLALWQPTDRMLKLSDTTNNVPEDDTKDPVTDQNDEMFYDEVMEIDCL
ncbi:hypothetical protein LOD99_12651 [Oopsacas minuta]|uniref:Uncharacterized protein n=1 Tax=Oopsacas minuta TaxID=111878 RepID=A0AAV7JCN0_9METZ|nr:hypothetical protein LOD99_12651 [Oopsacas minuta]